MNDTLGFIIWLVACILKLILVPILFLLGILSSIKNKVLGDYFNSMAISMDALGNVIGQYTFNKTLIKQEGYKFGNRHDTISYVLGKNNKTNTLTTFGKLIGSILNKIDKNHLDKAIQ